MPEYSISQIGTFEDCALQYKFSYVDRIKRYAEGVETFLGRRFIEDYYQQFGVQQFGVRQLITEIPSAGVQLPDTIMRGT